MRAAEEQQEEPQGDFQDRLLSQNTILLRRQQLGDVAGMCSMSHIGNMRLTSNGSTRIGAAADRAGATGFEARSSEMCREKAAAAFDLSLFWSLFYFLQTRKLMFANTTESI